MFFRFKFNLLCEMSIDILNRKIREGTITPSMSLAYVHSSQN